MSMFAWVKRLIGLRILPSTPAIVHALPAPPRRLRIGHMRPPSEAWMKQYNNLLAFRILCPDDWPKLKDSLPAGGRLSLWCYAQRQAHKKARLSQDRVRLLNEIHFPWDGRHYWYRQYRLLIAFREKHPSRWPTCREEWPAGNDIGNWCHSQRSMYKASQLAPNKIDLLNLIGFEWVHIYHGDIARHSE